MLEGALLLAVGLVVGGIAGWLYGFGRGVRAVARRMGMDEDELIRRMADR